MRHITTRTLYVTAFTIAAVFAIGIYLMSDSTSVSAQYGENAQRSTTARADMLAFALNMRSVGDHTVFGQKGIRGDGASNLHGKSATGVDEASLGENGSGIKARGDLSRSFSAINQLPCEELSSQLTGGSFKPGVYCAPSAALSQQMILNADGDPNGIFIFRMNGSMKTAEGFQMTLENGTIPGNVFFVAGDTASIADSGSISGSVIARNSIQVGKGAAIRGRALSMDGEVVLGEGSNLALVEGYIEICKEAFLPSDMAVAPNGNSLYNRIFQFRINGNVYPVPVGSCSGPILLPEGPNLIEELIGGTYTNQAGTWNNRFRLVSVTRTGPGTLGAINLPARTAVVNVAHGTVQNQTVVTFTNTFAIPAVIEICKRSVAPGLTSTPPVMVNDQDVTGFFDFIVDVVVGQTFTVPVGQCTPPIQVLVPATAPQAVPGQSVVVVSEIGREGYTLESVSTFPANRLGAFIPNVLHDNSIPCSVRQPNQGAMNPACIFPNPGGGAVGVNVVEGDISNQTTVNFFNRSNPGRVKVCKIAGPGIPVGTRFRFEVRGLAPSNPPPGPILPGVSVIRFVDVVAGPAEQGGFCSFVEGTFVVGADVLVTETSVLDPIPVRGTSADPDGSAANTAGLRSVAASTSEPSRSSSTDAKANETPEKTKRAEKIPYKEFRLAGDMNDGAPPRLAERQSDQRPAIDFNRTIKTGWPDVFSLAVADPQPSILGAIEASDEAVVFPDPGTPPSAHLLVSGLPADARPHSVAYFGSDFGLLSDHSRSRVHVVQISSASLLATIDTSTAGFDGSGSIAVAPNLTAALAMGSSNALYVIEGPFTPTSAITSLTLPGGIAQYQTQAIVFSNTGRAFVYHSTGISVLDAPYTSVAFTIPVTNTVSGAIGISPDGKTLLATDLLSDQVKIFQAPFSAASTFTTVTIPVPGDGRLDGIAVAPNGQHAIVVDTDFHFAASIAAPFSNSSTVEVLNLPADVDGRGFEDVGISADSQLVMLAGSGVAEALVLLKAPFTAAGSTSTYIPIVGASDPDRGNGAVRFLPPGLAPGLTVSKTAASTVPSGANLTYTINYQNTGGTTATNVVIKDPLPVGTTFVSATNGGVLQGGNVVFNIGTLNPGDSGSVSFTVTVNTASGGSVENNSYTIEGDGITPVPGPPVTTTVTAPDIIFGLSKVAAATVPTGGNLTYTINYQNTGTSYASNVVISDPLPAGTSFVSATDGGSLQGGNVVWNLGTLNAGASGSVSFTVMVNTAPGGTVLNTGYTIDADGVDPFTGPPVTTTVVGPLVSFAISKNAPATVPTGANLTYTLNYQNSGVQNATNVVISDPVPAGTTFVSASNSGTLQGGNVVWNIGTVNAGASGSVSFTVTVNTAAGGTVVNSGYTIDADHIDPVMGPPVTTNVVGPLVSFTVTKSGPASVASGSNLTYTINYQNSGVQNALNVVIKDPIPAGTTFVSATDGGTPQGGNVVWNLGTVNAGASGSVSFTVNVTASAGSTIINSGYTIESTGVPPVSGPPVSTTVTQSTPAVIPDPIRVSRIISSCGFVPAPATVQGIIVSPNPNLTTRQVVFTQRRGTCEVEYTNFVFEPTVLKLCKVAGPGIAVGTPFTFHIAIADGPLFPGLTVPSVTILAGSCVFVQGPYSPTNTTPPIGTFAVGGRVTVTEAPAPGTGIESVTSPTGTPEVDLPNRRATLTLGHPGGFNELIFANTTALGLESDIADRFTGDGFLFSNDVIFVRLFAAGLLLTNPAFNEFQRADAAPRATLGDAQITSGDVIQARRYAAGIDPPTPAGGPVGPIAPVVVESPLAALSSQGQRTIRAATSPSCEGSNTTVGLMLESGGNEAGAGLTVTFDPTILTNPVVSLGKDAAERGFELTTNSTNAAAGQIGILIDTLDAFPAAALERHLVNIEFQVVPGAPTGTTAVGFGGKTTSLSTSDVLGNLVETSYQSATMSIGGTACAASAGITVGGRVLSPDGAGLRNATVTLTGSDGTLRTVKTTSLGYYQIDDMRAGETYVVAVSSRRYRFASRVLQVSNSLSNFDFVGVE